MVEVKTIKFEDIKEKIVLIDGSLSDYISENGNVYKKLANGLFFKKKTYLNKTNGYIYCGITNDKGVNKTRRVHKLVALAFILNKNVEKYNIVGHLDNNKTNNTISNLYWTNVSENTKKAYDDGLAINKKGYEDSQSFPVIVYNMNMEEVARYGSVSICHKEMKVSKSTILRHCNGDIKGKSRTGYVFKFDDK